ncbi:MAG: hypothetical protein FWE67_08515 [Planctomycetaceae bacterium]|nr:hypothetical protein [Planctomycetaceae bacterium]
MNRQVQNKAIVSFRRRILSFLFLNGCISGMTLFLFMWGIAVLVFRCSGFENLPFFAFLLLFAFAVVPCPLLFTLRKLPSVLQTAAILDWKNSAGGLLMASLETNAGAWTKDWKEGLPNSSIPGISWQPGQTLLFLLAAVVFALASVFAPMPELSAAAAKHLNVDNEVKRLTTQLDVMEEENLLNIEEIETRKKELEKIQKDAEGEGPVKTFDALDHVADRLNQKAAEALEEAQRTVETLAKNETLINEVQEISSGLDENEKKSLTEGLARSLEKMLSENKSLAESLKKTLDKQSGENNKSGEQKSSEKNKALSESLKKKLQENDLKDLTQEEFKQLCEAMKQCSGDSQRMCENLQKAGFPIDKEMLDKLKDSQNIDRQEAERMLSDLWAECDACDGEKGENGERCMSRFSPRFKQKQDWTTDPDSPPEDTRYEKNEDTEGAEFKALILPPADLEAFLNSKKIGASISAPEDNSGNLSEEQGGAIKSVSETEGSSRKQTVYPQHRGTVSRFFEK